MVASRLSLIGLFLIALVSAGCSGGSGGSGSGTNSAANVPAACRQLQEIKESFAVVIGQVENCFPYKEGAQSTHLAGTFNGPRTSCSLGSRVVNVSPAVDPQDGFNTEPSQSISISNNGITCFTMTNGTNFQYTITNGSAKIWEVKQVGSAYQVITPTRVFNVTSDVSDQCPNQTNFGIDLSINPGNRTSFGLESGKAGEPGAKAVSFSCEF